MEYRLRGLRAGAWYLTFGNETGEADAFAQLDRFTAAGGNRRIAGGRF